MSSPRPVTLACVLLLVPALALAEPEERAATSSKPSTWLGKLGVGLIVGGGAVFVTGIGFAGDSQMKRSTLESAVNTNKLVVTDLTRVQALQLASDMRGEAFIGNILLAVGGALLFTGLLLKVLDLMP